jgi:hypothetical protein
MAAGKGLSVLGKCIGWRSKKGVALAHSGASSAAVKEHYRSPNGSLSSQKKKSGGTR